MTTNKTIRADLTRYIGEEQRRIRTLTRELATAEGTERRILEARIASAKSRRAGLLRHYKRIA